MQVSIWGDETTEARENMVGGVREEFLRELLLCKVRELGGYYAR